MVPSSTSGCSVSRSRSPGSGRSGRARLRVDLDASSGVRRPRRRRRRSRHSSRPASWRRGRSRHRRAIRAATPRVAVRFGRAGRPSVVEVGELDSGRVWFIMCSFRFGVVDVMICATGVVRQPESSCERVVVVRTVGQPVSSGRRTGIPTVGSATGSVAANDVSPARHRATSPDDRQSEPRTGHRSGVVARWNRSKTFGRSSSGCRSAVRTGHVPSATVTSMGPPLVSNFTAFSTGRTRRAARRLADRSPGWARPPGRDVGPVARRSNRSASSRATSARSNWCRPRRSMRPTQPRRSRPRASSAPSVSAWRSARIADRSASGIPGTDAAHRDWSAGWSAACAARGPASCTSRR